MKLALGRSREAHKPPLQQLLQEASLLILINSAFTSWNTFLTLTPHWLQCFHWNVIVLYSSLSQCPTVSPGCGPLMQTHKLCWLFLFAVWVPGLTDSVSHFYYEVPVGLKRGDGCESEHHKAAAPALSAAELTVTLNSCTQHPSCWTKVKFMSWDRNTPLVEILKLKGPGAGFLHPTPKEWSDGFTEAKEQQLRSGIWWQRVWSLAYHATPVNRLPGFLEVQVVFDCGLENNQTKLSVSLSLF